MNVQNLLDTRGYNRLLEACFPGSELTLYAAGGTLLWLNDNTPDAPRSIELSGWQRDVGNLYWHTEANRQIFAWPVLDEQKRVSHYLIVSSKLGIEDRAKLFSDLKVVVETIAETLNRHLYLNNELNSMARELSVRYEELNLVYYTDDEVRYLDEGRKALHGLAQNCNEHLNVDMTALLMPDQGISVVRHDTSNPQVADPFPTVMQNKLIDQLKAEPRTIVLNEPEETRALLDIACKLIASPVLDGNGRVSGTLIIVRNTNGADFSNSDRNLLMVMSGKAAKIIQSTYDSLTGLMRQDGFERSLNSSLAHVQQSDKKHALLHVNIDRMHLINDTLGYKAGDKVIQLVANILRTKLRETDRIARLGGDEFGILLKNCSARKSEQVAEKLCFSIADLKIEFETEIVDVSACIGVVSLDKDTDSIITAHAGAEIACSVAKERGRNRWHAYHKEDPLLAARQEQMEWVGRLKEALRNDQFELYSQRIVPLRSDIPGYHFEILVRMLDSAGNLVSPGLFLPVAERYQLMPQIDRWILRNTLAQLSSHRNAMVEQNIVCAINLSGQTLVDDDFAVFAADQFQEFGISPSLVCFEITETAAIANLADAERFMHDLKLLGCGFALDDFGAGLSSFAYLRSLPVDYLKLDGSFVTPIVDDETASAMLAAMNQIGQILGLRTVAEFVESQALIDRLIEMGVDYGQGYGISKPRPLPEEVMEFSRVAVTA